MNKSLFPTNEMFVLKKDNNYLLHDFHSYGPNITQAAIFYDKISAENCIIDDDRKELGRNWKKRIRAINVNIKESNS